MQTAPPGGGVGSGRTCACRYDTNDDYRLDQSEFQRLCSDVGRDLDSDEAKTALRVIDENENGYIEFSEFVRFWVDPKATLNKVDDVVRAASSGEEESSLDAAEAVAKPTSS